MKKGITIAIIALLVAGAGIAAWLLLRPADVIGPLPGTDPDDLYGTTAPVSTLPQPAVDSGSVQQLLRMVETPGTLYWEVNTELYGQAGVLARVGRLWRTADSRRVEVLAADGALLRLVQAESGSVTVENPDAGQSYTAPDGPQFAAEAVMGMADITALLDAPADIVRTAELRELNGELAVYVELYYTGINQKDEYYISLEYGLPIRANSYYRGELVYKAETVALTTELPPYLNE